MTDYVHDDATTMHIMMMLMLMCADCDGEICGANENACDADAAGGYGDAVDGAVPG